MYKIVQLLLLIYAGLLLPLSLSASTIHGPECHCTSKAESVHFQWHNKESVGAHFIAKDGQKFYKCINHNEIQDTVEGEFLAYGIYYAFGKAKHKKHTVGEPQFQPTCDGNICQVNKYVQNGKSLHDKLAKKKKYHPPCSNYGIHFIATLLLHPGDDKPKNFMVSPSGLLLNIDNEMSFKYQGCKSALFRFKKMYENIPQDVRNWISRMKVSNFMHRWQSKTKTLFANLDPRLKISNPLEQGKHLREVQSALEDIQKLLKEHKQMTYFEVLDQLKACSSRQHWSFREADDHFSQATKTPPYKGHKLQLKSDTSSSSST